VVRVDASEAVALGTHFEDVDVGTREALEEV
jgi:hypothetical protein